MKVSVIMPVYNAAPYIAESVNSLLRQTHEDWELIIVDDGSTDNSVEILSSFTDDRILVIRQSNQGQSVATNNGLKLACGQYIQFLDADDILDENKIKVQLSAISGSPESIAISSWAFFNSDIPDAAVSSRPIYFSGSPLRWIQALWSFETMMPNHGYLIPTSVADKADRFFRQDLFLNIDFEYFTRMALAANKIVYCPDAKCYYRKGVKDAKTYRPKLERQLSALKSRCMAIEQILRIDQSKETKYACRMALTILSYSYPSILKDSKQAIKQFQLGSFGKFGGERFSTLSAILGFENAIRIKKLLGI